MASKLTNRVPPSDLDKSKIGQLKTQMADAAHKTETVIAKAFLATWDELPLWQKDNEYIITGYVRETNNFIKTFQSLFYLHNESVNIYTHLIPGLIFLGIVFLSLDNLVVPIHNTTGVTDYMMFNLFFAGVFTCLLMSSTFHCLKSHSERIAIMGNKLDYLGIVALIVTSMISIMYYAFYDCKKAFYCFSTVTLLLGIACSVVSLDGKFRSREWRSMRAKLFVAFGLSALIPVVGGIFIYGLAETYVKIGLKWVLLEGVFYIIGAVLYGLRFPERLSPGTATTMAVKFTKRPWLGIAIPCLIISFIGYNAHYFILQNFLALHKQLIFELQMCMIWISYYLAIITNPGTPALSPRANNTEELENFCSNYLIHTSEIVFLVLLIPFDFFVFFTIFLLFVRCIRNQIFRGMTQIETWEWDRIESLYMNKRLMPLMLDSAIKKFSITRSPRVDEQIHYLLKNQLKIPMDEFVNFPYDLDICGNAKLFLGPWWSWLLPWGTPTMSDGTYFTKNELYEYDENADIVDKLLSLPWPPDGRRNTSLEEAASSSMQSLGSIYDSVEQELFIKKRADSRLKLKRNEWFNDWGESLEDFGVDVSTDS
ncbi:hypothetical protein ACO0QE_003646 [Hanseniaspora vineae]